MPQSTAWRSLYRSESKDGGRPPGELDRNAIWQRRWAVEWAVVFAGPYHEEPPEWEEVDLSV